MFSSKNFLVSSLMFRPLIHFEFIFVYGVRECSDFTLLHAAVQFSQHHLLKRLSLLCRRLGDHRYVGFSLNFLSCFVAFSTEFEQKILQFVRKHKLGSLEKSWRNQTPWLQTIIKTVWYWHKYRNIYQVFFSSLTLYEAAFIRLYCNDQTQHQFTTTKVSVLFLITSWGRLTEPLLHVSSSGHRPERESLFRTGVFTAEGKSGARTTSQLQHIHDLCHSGSYLIHQGRSYD